MDLVETTVQPSTAPPPTVSAQPCAIRVTNLCKNYPVNGGVDEVAALCDLNLEVPRGQHVAILGASGSGKSTLLGCLSGRLKPSKGSVSVDDRIATIHQDLRLVKHRTALQNVLHGALGRLSLHQTILRFPEHERRRAIRLLERVGLGTRMNWPVRRLSGGEQQRVAIARALMQDPQIILADEPVAALDSENARHIMNLLRELGREHNLTLVSVLHDCALAEHYADRIIGLDAGRIVFDGPAGQGRSFTPCGACQTLRQQFAESRPVRPVREMPQWMRVSTWVVVALVVTVLYGLSIWQLGISSRMLQGAWTGLSRFLSDLLPKSAAQVAAISWGALFGALLQTLGMSLIGTTLGIVVSWPTAALAAKNVGPRGIRPVARFILNTVRTLPSLIWALFFVAAVGTGPLAGVLALAAYSVGYLTKFFYEEFEAVDPGPPSALKEIGASGLQQFLHAVWPASRAGVLSSCIFMFEYNVRAASVLGIVGAGGIGWYLSLYFEFRDFPAVLACLAMLLAVVVILDAISTRVRAWLVN